MEYRHFCIKCLTILPLIFLVGCGGGKHVYDIKNFASYKEIDPGMASAVPSATDLKKKISVVVVDVEDVGVPLANQNALGKAIVGSLEHTIGSRLDIAVVDRAMAKQLKGEIMLSEAKSTGAYTGPVVADYAIAGKIHTTTFTSEHITHGLANALVNVAVIGGAVMMSNNRNNGANINMIRYGEYVSPSYQYDSDVTGVVRVVKLPSLEEIATISFRGHSSKEDDAGPGYVPKTSDSDLIISASNTAINGIADQVFNAIPPKTYITERRDAPKLPIIFKINAGKGHGIKTGDKVMRCVEVSDTDKITHSVSTYTRYDELGYVSTMVQPEIAWVIASDDVVARTVKLGDKVLVKHVTADE